MPRILINEKDNTTAGTSGSYANYDVLIVGYQTEFDADQKTNIDAELTKYNQAVSKNEKPDQLSTAAKMEQARRKKADSNGVYKFSTQQDFIDTIGLVAPDARTTAEGAEGAKILYHYGNQMAYELLNLGYTIVYKPITNVSEILDGNFWEIFKDKASYDFRFIVHGLLTSSEMPTAYKAVSDRLAEVEEAKAILDEIYKTAEASSQQTTNNDFEIADECQRLYARKFSALTYDRSVKGLINKSVDVDNDGSYEDEGDITGSETTYTTYALAVTGVDKELEALKLKQEQLSGGGITEGDINTANGHIANLAKYFEVNGNDFSSKNVPGRGDCIALIELDELCYVNCTSPNKPENLIIDAIDRMSTVSGDKGRYCAMTVPSVVYKLSDYSFVNASSTNRLFNNNKKFPGSFHYLACFMNSLKTGFAEWYAAAGYTRGVASYVIDYTTVKLGEIAINALEPRKLIDEKGVIQPKFACNVIANFRGSYYLWGNRTAHPLDTNDLVASHFLNIRQLCTTIKKQLYVACRKFTFDPNSDTLWVNFVNSIKPTLEVMKADQGIRDYKILKVYTDKKATLKAKIRIIPIEAVEDFDIEVSLEDSFGETSAVTGDIQ